MNIAIHRLDPNVPDPVESRRRAAGRIVRTLYGGVVFGILGFFAIYFGVPLVYLSGPGVVSSPMVVVSLPYVVQIREMNVKRGSMVKAGEEIGQVWSPQQDGVVANYMRALADVAAKSAELRVKVRVAKETLESAESYRRVTEEAVDRIEASSAASTAFRVEVFRERAAAQKAVLSQAAEVAEASVQLTYLDKFSRQVREQLDDVTRNFADGRVFAPVDGIVTTIPARVGQSLAAGTPVAEIADPSDIFVNWYIPNRRLVDPEVGNEVIVLFGHWRWAGRITEILEVSDVYGGTKTSLSREQVATQIARVRFSLGTERPALNSTVYVHMHYTEVASRIAWLMSRMLGLDRDAAAAPPA
jgi:multidrug resistance efflux pump